MRTPMFGEQAFGYPVNVTNQTESECVSTLEQIRYCRREREDTRCQGFQNLDVTSLYRKRRSLATISQPMAMVPYELEAPGAMVPNVSLCRDEHLLLVTK